MKFNEKIENYIQLIKDYNEQTNIYSKKSYDKLNFHIQDCINLSNIIGNNKHILDIGSGSGLPAIILAIENSDNFVVAVESKSRKTKFLEHVKKELQLKNLTVIQDDINHYTRKSNQKFDLVTCKAFGSIDKIKKCISPLQTLPSHLYMPISENQANEYKLVTNTEIINLSTKYYYLKLKF